MNRILNLLLFLLAGLTTASASLPDELNREEHGVTGFSVSDPEYEWSQADSKQAKVLLKTEGLLLESKKEDGVAFSVCELPIDVEGSPEFIFGIKLRNIEIDDKNGFGIIFDYVDSRNYKGISIGKKQYVYFTVKDGVTSEVKSGPVKYKEKNVKLILKRENGGVEFVLNGIEVCKLRKIELSSSYFGVFVSGKGKVTMPGFIMYIPEQGDSEQSTSDV